VVDNVLGSPSLFGELIGGLFVEDPVIRMRSADAVEKITLVKPDLLKPYKRKLLRLAGNIDQQEVRWHLAQILPRLNLGPQEKCRVVEILHGYLDDRSKIVVTFSLQALADLAAEDHKLRARTIGVLEKFAETGSPAIKSRSRKLLRRLK